MSKPDAKTPSDTKPFGPNESVEVQFFRLWLPDSVIGEKNKLVLGRRNSHNNPDIDLSVAGEASNWVSKEHLFIYLEEQMFMVVASGACPTYLNEFEIKPNYSGTYGMEKLSDGDTLTIGKIHIKVHYVDANNSPDGWPLLPQLTKEVVPGTKTEVKELSSQISDESDFNREASGGGGLENVSVDEDPRWVATPERLARERKVVEKIEAKRRDLTTATPPYAPTGEPGTFIGWAYDGGYRPIYRTPSGIEFFVPIYPSYDSSYGVLPDEHEDR